MLKNGSTSSFNKSNCAFYLVDHNNVNFSQLKVAVSSTTDRMETELDQIVKAVKTVTYLLGKC